MFNLSLLDDVRHIEVIGDRPSGAGKSADWIFFNAARPLACTSPFNENNWTGDFVHGIFYAAVDLSQPEAEAIVKKNIDLDGTIVSWITADDHKKRVQHAIDEDMFSSFYGKDVSDIVAKMSKKDVDGCYRQVVTKSTNGKMRIFGDWLK